METVTDDDEFTVARNGGFSSHFDQTYSKTDNIIKKESPKNNKWSQSSSSDNFGRVLRRELSSCRKPTLNRPNADQNRKTEYIVEMSCIFIRLGEIDTLHETFFAEAFLQAKWNDKTLTGDSYDPHENWNPDIIIEVT